MSFALLLIFSSIIAAIALYIAVSNSHFSEEWQAKQLQSLNTLISESTDQNTNLSEINKNISNSANLSLTRALNGEKIVEESGKMVELKFEIF